MSGGMVVGGDIHLRPESEETVWKVLRALFQRAAQRGCGVALLGDIWHVRYAVPVHLLNGFRQMLREFTQSTGLAVRILPGNHDQIDVNGRHALEHCEDIPGVRVYHEPCFEPETGTWLPYRKDPGQLLAFIAQLPPEAVGPDAVGWLHHGIVGAFMNSGHKAGPLDGLTPESLPFGRVYCAHWHRHQVIQQCVYVGSQWQTRSDEAGQQKGFLDVYPGRNLVSARFDFVPLDVGRTHHRVDTFQPHEIARIRPGDEVRVPAGTSQQMVDAISALGASVFVAPEQAAQAAPRLGAADAPLRAQAESYLALQQLPDGLDAAYLMAMYDEIVAGADS